MLESKIEAYLKKEVVKRGGLCYKWSSPQNRGVPDRIVLLNSKIYFIELKSEKGELSPHQRYFKKCVCNHLNDVILYAVLSSKEEVDQYLGDIE